jgi:hypothetical protein
MSNNNLTRNDIEAQRLQDAQPTFDKDAERALNEIEAAIRGALKFISYDDLGAEIDVILVEVRKERNVKNTLFPFNALGLGL